MIKTVQEGLEKYKAALREYKEWTDKLRKQYDTLCGKGKWSPMANFSKDDFYELSNRSAELEAMVEILGLSKEEETAIDKECGIQTPEELAA